MTDHCSAGLPVLPAGMTNELFYKEQAEYWRQIATQNHIPTPAQAASNQSSHSERISAADKDRECSIDGGRTQIVVLTREAIKRAIHPFCFSGKNADAIADSILALAPVAPAPVSLLEAIHRLEDMIPKLRIDHSHREAEILHNIIHHLSRLASFEDPKTPGMVSVGLLNTERSTGDRLRVENDQLRAALAAQPPAAPVEKRPPGAGPAGATFGGFEPLSPPQSCSADNGGDILERLLFMADVGLSGFHDPAIIGELRSAADEIKRLRAVPQSPLPASMALAFASERERLVETLDLTPGALISYLAGYDEATELALALSRPEHS